MVLKDSDPDKIKFLVTSVAEMYECSYSREVKRSPLFFGLHVSNKESQDEIQV